MRCVIPLLLLAAATPAGAAELRELCPDRPGKATPPCIVDAGHVQIETGLADWSFDRRGGIGTDDVAFAATEVRVGLTQRLEAEVSWTPYATSTVRDRRTGSRDHAEGTGDVTFGLRQSLANPDGKGVSVAIAPFVTMPVGHSGIGNSGWSGGVLLPFSVDLGGDFALGATPEIDWSANAAADGHHATYTGVVALSRSIGKVTAGVELWASRDDEPGARLTQASADVTLAWGVSDRFQIDAGANAGLNRATPLLELYVGIARRF